MYNAYHKCNLNFHWLEVINMQLAIMLYSIRHNFIQLMPFPSVSKTYCLLNTPTSLLDITPAISKCSQFLSGHSDYNKIPYLSAVPFPKQGNSCFLDITPAIS